MRYRFVDEIVSLVLDAAPRIEVAKRVCVAPSAVEPTPGARA